MALIVFGGVVGDDWVEAMAGAAAVATDNRDVVVDNKELADTEPPAAAVCRAAAVGEMLVSLSVSGSALRGKIPLAKLAAAISAALYC